MDPIMAQLVGIELRVDENVGGIFLIDVDFGIGVGFWSRARPMLIGSTTAYGALFAANMIAAYAPDELHAAQRAGVL